MNLFFSITSKYKYIICYFFSCSQVKEAMKINAKLAEANISSEEFTQRMAGLEKRLQQLTAERDSLKDENRVSRILSHSFGFKRVISLDGTFKSKKGLMLV